MPSNKNKDLAVEYKLEHSLERYKAVAQRFQVSRSTLNDRCKGKHLSHQEGAIRHISLLQEGELIRQINAYAARGTLLTPQHVHELAEAIAGEKIGSRWVLRFVKRHSDKITSKFHTYRELGRLQADTPATRAAWYSLVSPWNLCLVHIAKSLR